jgi:hypothetical protein
MMFGTMSINVKFFIRELLERLPDEIVGRLIEANDGKDAASSIPAQRVGL